MGALAAWADSEAVLPAYLIGMVLAGWQQDLQNRIRNAIDDFFFDQTLAPGAINLGPDVIDMIADDVLTSARVRMADDGRIQ